MALVCKNISKIKQFFSNSLSSHLEKIKIENLFNVVDKDVDSNHKIRLNHYLSFYNNLKNSNLEVGTSVKPKLVVLENLLEERIMNGLESYENFGQDSLINSLQIISKFYIKNPTAKYKDIIIKILDKMNENPDLFKKSDLENTISLLSNPEFYHIKSEVSQSLNFFKNKTKSHKTLKSMGLDNLKDSNKFHINIDSENNLIVLKDKFNENRYIIFAQFIPNSLNLYKSLITTMNAGVILFDKEPHQLSEITNTLAKERMNLCINKYDTFQSQSDFKEIILKNRNSLLDGDDKSNAKISQFSKLDNLSDIETLILHCLGLKSKKVILFDVPFHNYTKSFFDSVKNISLSDLRTYLILLNLFEVVNWLSVQELNGCKNCASFFDRNEVNWTPHSLEFLIDKNFLPNSKFLNSYRVNKVYNSISVDNSKENVLIIADNPRNLCRDFLNFDQENNSKLDYDDFYKEKDFTQENSKNISLALMLKDDFRNFYKNVPIKLMDVKLDSIELLRKNIQEDFVQLYGLEGMHGKKLFELYEEIQMKNSNENIESNVNNRRIKKKVGKSPEGNFKCEPSNYLKTDLIDFIKDIKH